ncbi:hypothetical protein IQ273_18615 [Nodosilinea sp. LEGE 07298]|uniref:hypothetical protein n=1 Tax=Nodosilinea sp. LEGE 07298 TaxID=2777970 RepID=UPI00187E0DF7|nr:hypothetical protein [Nodosilinea sp. LEGE 07298]MBE9111421.1 hypothetical protein [Nodosilinea sp. LEGE 07298]
MLLDECQILGQQVQGVVALKKYSADLNKFRERQQKLEALVDDLRPLLIALDAFRERNLISVNFSQKADQVLAEVAAIISEFQKDKGWIIEQFKFNALQAKVSALKVELKGQLQQAWLAYKQKKVPITSSELLELLGKIDTFKPAVQKIQRRIAELKAVEYPQDISHFQRIDQAIQDLETAWGSLDDVPTDVQSFLRAATTHGASIDSLTPEVKNWLIEQGITRFFYIQLGN